MLLAPTCGTLLTPEPTPESRGGGPPRPEPIAYAGRREGGAFKACGFKEGDAAAAAVLPGGGRDASSLSLGGRPAFADERGDAGSGGAAIGGVDATDKEAVASVKACVSASASEGWGGSASSDAISMSTALTSRSIWVERKKRGGSRVEGCSCSDWMAPWLRSPVQGYRHAKCILDMNRSFLYLSRPRGISVGRI